jgi:hydroxyacylglutathione hydrolase
MTTLPIQDALKMQTEGAAALVDIRPPNAFATRHVRGALNVPFSSRGIAQRIKTIAPAGKPIILVGDDAQKLQTVAEQATAGGLQMAGSVEGTPEAWAREGVPLQSMGEVSVHALPERLRKEPGAFTVVDVREPMEWETGHVPGAVLISLGSLRQHLGELDKDRSTLVICEAGIRSAGAASILLAEGFKDVSNVVEGTGGYRNAGYELQTYTAPEEE